MPKKENTSREIVVQKPNLPAPSAIREIMEKERGIPPIPFKPEFLLQTGSKNWVCCMCVSPDSYRIVSGSDDGCVRIWDAESGNLLRILKLKEEHHFGDVQCVSVSRDNLRIVSGSWDKTIRIWDMESGETLRILTGHEDSVDSVCVSPDNRRIVSGSQDHTVRIWDMESGEMLRILKGHQGGIDSVCVSPDSRRIVSGSGDNTVRIWDTESGEMLRILKGHEGNVFSVCVSSDSRRIVSGSGDNTVRIWDMESGKLIHILTGHENSVDSVCVSPDNRRIVSQSLINETIRIWDMKSGKLIRSFTGNTDIERNNYRYLDMWAIGSLCIGGATVLYITIDNCRIISESNGAIRIWDMETGACIAIMLASGEDWITCTPDGYFIGSEKFVSFLNRGDNMFLQGSDFKEYRNRFERPDIIRERLRG